MPSSPDYSSDNEDSYAEDTYAEDSEESENDGVWEEPPTNYFFEYPTPPRIHHLHMPEPEDVPEVVPVEEALPEEEVV